MKKVYEVEFLGNPDGTYTSYKKLYVAKNFNHVFEWVNKESSQPVKAIKLLPMEIEVIP